MLCWCAAFVAHADSGRRVALVVGNGAYQNALHLPNPPNDAKAVATALRGLDFEVIEAVDLDQPDMIAKVDEFSAKLEGADAGLFFYAGHGLQVGGENYLVPIDARLQREAQVRLQTLPLQTVLATMEATVATRIVLLDACRDNPLANRLKSSLVASRSSAVGQGLAEIRTAVGTLIAYATGPGDVASDGTGTHSPFTGALLKHISTPGIEIRQVFGRVRDEVLKQTGERQVPWDSSSLRGEFYFKRLEPTIPAPSTQLASPTSTITAYDGRDREAFEVIAESRRAHDFVIFLQHFPESILRPFAQSRLEELTKFEVNTPQPLNDNGDKSLSSEVSTITTSSSPSPTVDVLADLRSAEASLNISRDEWRKLQQSLTALGFDTRGADGRPGSNTRHAIMNWQSSKAVIANGYFGPLQRELIVSEAKASVAARGQETAKQNATNQIASLGEMAPSNSPIKAELATTKRNSDRLSTSGTSLVDVIFHHGSNSLSDGGKDRLYRVARLIKQNRSQKIVIKSIAAASDGSNLEALKRVSLDRASIVRDYLYSQGIWSNQMLTEIHNPPKSADSSKSSSLVPGQFYGGVSIIQLDK